MESPGLGVSSPLAWMGGVVVGWGDCVGLTVEVTAGVRLAVLDGFSETMMRTQNGESPFGLMPNRVPLALLNFQLPWYVPGATGATISTETSTIWDGCTASFRGTEAGASMRSP